MPSKTSFVLVAVLLFYTLLLGDTLYAGRHDVNTAAFWWLALAVIMFYGTTAIGMFCERAKLLWSFPVHFMHWVMGIWVMTRLMPSGATYHLQAAAIVYFAVESLLLLSFCFSMLR